MVFKRLETVKSERSNIGKLLWLALTFNFLNLLYDQIERVDRCEVANVTGVFAVV